MFFFDWIFPKRCAGCGVFGSYLCVKCFVYVAFVEQGFCAVCRRAAVGGFTHPVCRTKYDIDGVFVSVSYSGVVKRLIHRLKYQPYVLDIRGLLGDFFYEGIIQKEAFVGLLGEKNVFVPIPLHSDRIRQRGYNQSEVLGMDLIKKFFQDGFLRGKREASFVLLDCLVRKKVTLPQYGLSQKARVENMTGAFVFREDLFESLQSVSVVFLVDDIVTTGATMREAARVLKRAGVRRVYGLALAHGQ
jgi:ComF family protein